MVDSHRKSGSRAGLVARAGRTSAENQLLESIIKYKEIGTALLRAGGVPIGPLAVYGYLPFPILFKDYTKMDRVPRWDQLSKWMKLQITILAFQEWKERFLTFSVHLHSVKSMKAIASRIDLRRLVRDRVRKHLNRTLKKKAAYFFVIEGASKLTAIATKIHVHGGVWLEDPAEKSLVLRAIEKGLAQGVPGYAKEPRAMRPVWFWGGGANYGNYLTKLTHVPDHRLGSNRLTFSNEAIKAGATLWDIITGRVEGVSLDQLKREQGIGLD